MSPWSPPPQTVSGFLWNFMWFITVLHVFHEIMNVLREVKIIRKVYFAHKLKLGWEYEKRQWLAETIFHKLLIKSWVLIVVVINADRCCKSLKEREIWTINSKFKLPDEIELRVIYDCQGSPKFSIWKAFLLVDNHYFESLHLLAHSLWNKISAVSRKLKLTESGILRWIIGHRDWAIDWWEKKWARCISA